LEKLHEIGIEHRDLKCSNFLYNKQTKKGYLIDFGLSEINPKIIK